MSSLQRKNLTLDDFLIWEAERSDRYEFLGGEVYTRDGEQHWSHCAYEEDGEPLLPLRDGTTVSLPLVQLWYPGA